MFVKDRKSQLGFLFHIIFILLLLKYVLTRVPTVLRIG